MATATTIRPHVAAAMQTTTQTAHNSRAINTPSFFSHCHRLSQERHRHSNNSREEHTLLRKPSAAHSVLICFASSSSSSSYSSTSTSPPIEFDLACPICQTTPIKITQISGHPTGNMKCRRCQRTYEASSASVDLTLTSGVQQKVYEQKAWGGVEIFRNPLVSLAYERGWRQGFAWAGFPGGDFIYLNVF